MFIQDNSVTTGAGLTGLVFNAAGLTAYYYREGAASAVAITLATMTLGTWATGGFIVADGTNMPGVYQLGIPDAALASGANSVTILLKGATNMAPVVLEIDLAGDSANVIVKKNTAIGAFPFIMVDLSGIPAAGLTVAAERSINGAAFGACANSVSAISNGAYKIDLAAADLNGTTILLRFSATGARDSFISLTPMP